MVSHGRHIALILCLFFLSACAKEKQKKTGWSSFPVTIYTDPAVVSNNANKADFIAAMDFWEEKAGRTLFDYKGDWTGSAPFEGSPDKPSAIFANVIFFLNPWPFSGNTAGQTTLLSSEHGWEGSIIMLNPNIPLCSGNCEGESFRTSKQKLLAHELGHFLGLGHNQQNEEDIMYPSLAPGGSLANASVDIATLGQIVQ